MPDLMEWRGTNIKPLRLLKTPFEEWRPAIGPDGTVYLISNPKNQFDIFTPRPGAAEPKLIYGSTADQRDPAINPNGTWLAFASKKSGICNLMVKNMTTNRVTILTDSNCETWGPSFHPDGNLLVFGRFADKNPLIYGRCLYGELIK